MASLLGDKLVRRDGTSVSPAEALAGADYVGIYFSASWCGPCRGFTPRLAAWYKTHAEKSKIRIVFSSADNEEAAFKSYFADMPWDLAIPFKSGLDRELGKKFKVQGIPTLVILDAAGNVITSEGREGVVEDEGGCPWRPAAPKGVWELLGAGSGVVTDKAGVSTPVSELQSKNKYLMLYFSAHWCPPCKQFTPLLASWYSETLKAGKVPHGAETELVFISSDRDEESYREYLGEMPWPALPFAERKTKEALSKRFKVSGIPTLILLDAATGEVLNSDARTRVGNQPEDFPWAPKLVEKLDDMMDVINDVPIVVAFTDKLTDAAAEVSVHEAMTEAARSVAKADGTPSTDIRFCTAGEGDEACEQVRHFLGLSRDKDGSSNVRLIVIDIPEGRKAVFGNGGATVPSGKEVTEFVAAFKAGTATFVKVKEAPQ